MRKLIKGAAVACLLGISAVALTSGTASAWGWGPWDNGGWGNNGWGNGNGNGNGWGNGTGSFNFGMSGNGGGNGWGNNGWNGWQQRLGRPMGRLSEWLGWLSGRLGRQSWLGRLRSGLRLRRSGRRLRPIRRISGPIRLRSCCTSGSAGTRSGHEVVTGSGGSQVLAARAHRFWVNAKRWRGSFELTKSGARECVSHSTE